MSPKSGQWSNDRFGVDKVTVSRSRGNRWPDGGVGKTKWFDVCPECFENKIIPFIHEFRKEKISSEDWEGLCDSYE